MPTVDRKSLLSRIQSIQPALAKREILEQSTCAVFDQGNVVAFNEECLIRVPSGLPADFRGAIKAKPLIDLLKGLKDDNLDITRTQSELQIKGDNSSAGIVMQAEVRLPIGMVEQPGDWRPIHPDLYEALSVAVSCASQDEHAKFAVRCINVTPNWIEGCDNYRLGRFYVQAGFPEQFMVRRASVQHVPDYKFTEMSTTPRWLHFRDAEGLVFSCQRYNDAYPDLSPILEVNVSAPAEFPKSLSESTKLADIFASDSSNKSKHMTVRIEGGRIIIRGQSAVGWYEENLPIAYEGKPVSFAISPSMMAQIAKEYTSVEIAEKKLRVRGPDNRWEFIAYLKAAE